MLVRRLAVIALFPLLLVALAACGSSGGGSPGGDDPNTDGSGGGDAATTLSTSSEFLSLKADTAGTLTVEADGAWTVEASSEPAWLSVSPTSGSGDATIEVRVDRAGLDPSAAYAGGLLFKGAEPLASVTVTMRFPHVTGSVLDGSGSSTVLDTRALDVQIEPTGLGALEAGVDYVPNEVLVTLDRTMTQALTQESGRFTPANTIAESDVERVARELAADHGLTLERVVWTDGPTVLLGTLAPLETAIAELRADGRVRFAEPNGLYEARAVPDDPYYPDQAWHYEMINLPAAWDTTRGDESVTVAVIDLAFDAFHGDLEANLLPGFDFADGDTNLGDPGDYCGSHGTHVAGTIAAVTNNGTGVAGVAPNVRVLPLKIGEEASDCPLSADAAISAIYYAAGMASVNGSFLPEPVDVINMSFGGGPYNAQMEIALTQALGRGVTLVTAAGNDNALVQYYPEAYASTITVGALAYDGTRAAYSNYGGWLEVMAPGGTGSGGSAYQRVFSTRKLDAYGTSVGTSMASPHVAGVAALMMSANRDLTPTDVRGILQATAVDLGASGPDASYGFGRVDAAAAVAGARGSVEATFDEVHVLLEPAVGGTAHATRAEGSGAFAFEGVPAGEYKLFAGTDVDNDGQLGEDGEFYGEKSVTVEYEGDAAHNVSVTLQ